MTYNVEVESDERTPLLMNNDTVPERRPITPLPKLQIAIVLLLQVCEPITSQSIFPYINQVRSHDCGKILMLISCRQLISELDVTGGDERKVGYYAGLIVRLTVFLEYLHSFRSRNLCSLLLKP